MCYPPGRSVFTWVCSNIKVHIACKGKDATVNAVDAFLLRRDGCTVNWEIYIQDWARHQGLLWRYGARAWFKSVSRAKGHLISASTHTVQSTCVQCMLLICLETLSVSWQSNWEIMNSVTRNLQWGWKWASRRKKEEKGGKRRKKEGKAGKRRKKEGKGGEKWRKKEEKTGYGKL